MTQPPAEPEAGDRAPVRSRLHCLVSVGPGVPVVSVEPVLPETIAGGPVDLTRCEGQTATNPDEGQPAAFSSVASHINRIEGGREPRPLRQLRSPSNTPAPNSGSNHAIVPTMEVQDIVLTSGQAESAAAQTDAVVSWILDQAAITACVTWRRILSMDLHRGARFGGDICPAIARLIQYENQPDKMVKAVLELPSSWAPGDGVTTGASALGTDMGDATENVCKKLVTQRLVTDALHHWPESMMRLSPTNWRIGVDVLLRTIRNKLLNVNAEPIGGVAATAALGQPELHQAGGRQARRKKICGGLYVPPAAHQVEQRNEAIAAFLLDICENEKSNEGGWAQPHNLKQMWVQQSYNGTRTRIRPFTQLQRYVEPGQLLKFLQDRPLVFQVRLNGPNLDAFRKTGGVPDAVAGPVQPAAHVRAEPLAPRPARPPPPPEPPFARIVRRRGS